MTDHLLPSERLPLNQSRESRDARPTDVEISERYSRGEIRIVTDQARTQLAELPAVLASGRWELQPEYQRRTRWNEGKQSRLIESFIMNVPVPPIFLYEYEYSKYQVMDGLQRLTALKQFYDNKLRLTELEYWTELEGRTYGELPPLLRQGIDRRYLSSIVLLYETAEDSEKAARLRELVFERINSGGEALTYQEARNATSNGPLNDILPRLARTPSFCKAWRIPEPDENEIETGNVSEEVRMNERFRQMEDVEMVLRFFARRQDYVPAAPARLRKLLDEYWATANKTYSVELTERIGQIFVDTINLVYDVLGEGAFYIRRDRSGVRSWVPRPTLLAYDCIMAAFSRFIQDGDTLRERKVEVRKRLERLYDDNAEAFDGRKTDPKDLKRRDNLVENMLKTVIEE